MPMVFHIETSVRHGGDLTPGEFDCKWLSYDWVSLNDKVAAQQYGKIYTQAAAALANRNSALNELHKVGTHRQFSAFVDGDGIDMGNLHDLLGLHAIGDITPMKVELQSYKEGATTGVTVATLNARVKVTGYRLTGSRTGYVFNFKIIGGIDEEEEDVTIE
jgi:hypothetical protein